MLTFENFSKSYGKKKAVENLNLVIEVGDLYGFIGKNGAGKTTSLRAAAGILEPTEGEIFVDGISMKDNPVGCKSVTAFIPDNPELYDYLTGVQYLKFIADIYGVDGSVREERVNKYAEALEIKRSLGALVGSYSHGMKQKIALVGALIHEPKLLLLDEPFVGLDPTASRTLKNIMQEMCDRGCAIFFSTHVLEVAEKLCNKIAVIKDGKLISSGTTAEVKGNESLEDAFLELVEEG
jgi:ABC-2 type transport system ATP-binding protein